MKKYNVDDKATFKGKEVKIVKKTENFSNGNIIYLLDNGKKVTGKSLTPIKTNIKKLAKDIKSLSKKASDIQIKKPIEIKDGVSVLGQVDKDAHNNTDNKEVEKSDLKKEKR